MKRLLVALFLMAPLLGSQSGHGAGSQEPSILWKWANFILLAGALAALIRKYAGPFFESRNQAIRGAFEQAEQVRAEAERRIADIEAKVANFEREVQSLREQSRQEMAAEAERMQQITARTVAKIFAQAEMEIASASKHARQQLKAFSADLALELAAAEIRQRMTPAQHQTLVNQFTAKLGSVMKN